MRAYCINCGRKLTNAEIKNDKICSKCQYRINHNRISYKNQLAHLKLVAPRQREQKRRYGINVESHRKKT